MKIYTEHFADLLKYDASAIIPDTIIAEYLLDTDESIGDLIRVSRIQLMNNPLTSGRPLYVVWFIKGNTGHIRGNMLSSFTTRKEALSFAKISIDAFLD